MTFLEEWNVDHHGPKSLKGTGSWNDPTQHPLPHAPSMSIYCMYGVGLPTERMFYYHPHDNKNNSGVPFAMDEPKDDEAESIMYGIKMTNGDGSVPLLSLGYMCAEGWKRSDLNPGNTRIVTREHSHVGSFQASDPLRQGPTSGEHCDILGNHQVLEDIIKIAAGKDVEPRIVSNIEDIAQRIREHPWNNKERRE